MTEPAPLPARSQPDPIRAYKLARLAPGSTPGGWELRGVGLDQPYAPIDTAVHAHLEGWFWCPPAPVVEHTAPQVACSCGFYAVPARAIPSLLADYPGANAVLTVDLSGTVIVHEGGFRAARQAVLSVGLVVPRWPEPAPSILAALAGALGTEVGWWRWARP